MCVGAVRRRGGGQNFHNMARGGVLPQIRCPSLSRKPGLIKSNIMCADNTPGSWVIDHIDRGVNNIAHKNAFPHGAAERIWVRPVRKKLVRYLGTVKYFGIQYELDNE